MKKNFLFSLLGGFLMAITMGACSWENESHTTPTITYQSPILRNSADTLLITVTEDGYVLDTLQVGDTALFDVFFYTGLNNMQSIRIKHDSTHAELHYYFRNQLDSIVLPSSDFERGEFFIEQGTMGLRMQVGYIATAPTPNAKLQFYVESDSKYSPGKRTIITPIVPKKADE